MATTRQIALLRGINLGSRRRVGMPKLRELLGAAGYEDVRTHLQSGNVVLSAKATGARLERELEHALADGLRMEIAVVVRTRAEVARVVAHDPLADVADNPARYLVSFLSARPTAAAARKLKELDVAPEQFVLHGRELYAWHPKGVQRSKLNQALAGGVLGVTATARNWSTVTKLLELADA